eukprot:gb/GECH01011353.1/.p1 GENE.gb/GECH01011353.1/~~gb/GECH01011353.1/.p1  ORF type:complete len:376 (+),score=116.54 gb/GECH01011353.1/:1-1128(+)
MEAINSNLGSGWKVYFYDQPRAQTWQLQTPQFKQCKKKKEFYSDKFENLWYKHPYKYDMLLRATNIDDNVLAHIKLLYADTLDIVKPLNSKPTITKNENFFHPTQNDSEQEVHVGPFQYQVCSYKLDNRDVCLGVYLMLPPELGSVDSKVVAILVSPRFTVRSKKPVQQKNKRKRKAEEECDLSLDIPATKKLKAEEQEPSLSELMSQQIDNNPNAFNSIASLFPQQQQQQTQQQQQSQSQQIHNNSEQNGFPQDIYSQGNYNYSVPSFSSLGPTDRKQRLIEILGLCNSEEREFVKKQISEIETSFMPSLDLPPQQDTHQSQPQPQYEQHQQQEPNYYSLPPLPSPQAPGDNMGFFDMRPTADTINVADYFKEF